MRKQHGFTVIEMMIALVVGGFILLVVFLAVPATQRTSRNTVRHKDASAELAGVLEYKSQTANGKLPDTCDNTDNDCFVRSINLAFYKNKPTDQAVVSYAKLDHPYNDSNALLHIDDEDVAEKMALYSYAICNDTGTAPTGAYASPQSVVVQYALETFSGVAMQCKQV